MMRWVRWFTWARPRHRYRVLVDDNFHYMDAEHRYHLGDFPTCERAVAACQAIVDQFLLDSYTAGMAASQLGDMYMQFGEDPWIDTDDPGCRFSAWEYARRRAAEICR